jgi:predicted nucleotidyltransferase
MTHVLEGHRQALADLCKKHRGRRLDVFGSAARGDFDEAASDVDLLVEFDDMPHADRADAYLGFLTAVEALLGRRIDLVEVSAVRNPSIGSPVQRLEGGQLISEALSPFCPHVPLRGLR